MFFSHLFLFQSAVNRTHLKYGISAFRKELYRAAVEILIHNRLKYMSHTSKSHYSINLVGRRYILPFREQKLFDIDPNFFFSFSFKGDHGFAMIWTRGLND